MAQATKEASSTLGFDLGYHYATSESSPSENVNDSAALQSFLDRQVADFFTPLLDVSRFRQLWYKGYHAWHVQEAVNSYLGQTFPDQKCVRGQVHQQGDNELSPWTCDLLVEDEVSGLSTLYQLHICRTCGERETTASRWAVTCAESDTEKGSLSARGTVIQKADEYAALIIQQAREGYHTAEDVADMKRCHEELYGVTMDDPSYVGVCRALDILQAGAPTPL